MAEPVRDWRRRRGTHTRETRETLPPEVRMVIEQLKAAQNDHEARIAQLERINSVLVAEAAAKVKGAA